MSTFIGTGNGGKLAEFKSALGADVCGFSDLDVEIIKGEMEKIFLKIT